jgi:hypothetical protein
MVEGRRKLRPEAEAAWDLMAREVEEMHGKTVTDIGLGVVRDEDGIPVSALMFGISDEGDNLCLIEWEYAYNFHQDGECDCFGCLLEGDPDGAMFMAGLDFTCSEVTLMSMPLEREGGSEMVH